MAKKWVMEKFPLDEGLFWGKGEDVQWSKSIRTGCKYVFNPYSTVGLLKIKAVISRRCDR